MKFKKTAYNSGWFKFCLAAWADGNSAAIEAMAPNPAAEHSATLRAVADTLYVIETAGVSRRTRKGWHEIAVPMLGQVSWKSGSDFRTGGAFLIIRLNGRVIARAWPQAGCREVSADFPAMPPQARFAADWWRRWAC